MRVDIGKECLGIEDGQISSNNYRVIAFDVCEKLIFLLYLKFNWLE